MVCHFPSVWNWFETSLIRLGFTPEVERLINVVLWL